MHMTQALKRLLFSIFSKILKIYSSSKTIHASQCKKFMQIKIHARRYLIVILLWLVYKMLISSHILKLITVIQVVNWPAVVKYYCSRDKTFGLARSRYWGNKLLKLTGTHRVERRSSHSSLSRWDQTRKGSFLTLSRIRKQRHYLCQAGYR